MTVKIIEAVSKRQLLFLGWFPLLSQEGCPSGARAGWYVLCIAANYLSAKKEYCC